MSLWKIPTLKDRQAVEQAIDQALVRQGDSIHANLFYGIGKKPTYSYTLRLERARRMLCYDDCVHTALDFGRYLVTSKQF